MCILRLILSENTLPQISQMNFWEIALLNILQSTASFPSWIDSLWIIKTLLQGNDFPQVPQLNVGPPWLEICDSRYFLSEKNLPHFSQLNNRCTDSICFVKTLLQGKDLPHVSQHTVFFSCTESLCLFKWAFREYDFPQILGGVAQKFWPATPISIFNFKLTLQAQFFTHDLQILIIDRSLSGH